jgi:hypothetical protein
MTFTAALSLLELVPPFTKSELNNACHQALMVLGRNRLASDDESRARANLVSEAFPAISRALEAGYDFNKAADHDKAIADYTERIRLTPRRISKRGIEGRWHLNLRETISRTRPPLRSQG